MRNCSRSSGVRTSMLGFLKKRRCFPSERTIRLNPRSPQLDRLKVEYARVLLMLGRTGEAITTLEPFVYVEPGHRNTLRRR